MYTKDSSKDKLKYMKLIMNLINYYCVYAFCLLVLAACK